VLFVSYNLIAIVRKRVIVYAIFAAAILSFLILHPRNNCIRNYKKYDLLYRYIGNLPKDVLIAGNPKSEIIRSAPFFAKRAVFACEKLVFQSLAYQKQERATRTENLAKALYGSSIREVSDFVSLYKIDYLLVEERHYQKFFFHNLVKSVRFFDKEFVGFIDDRLDQKVFSLLEFARRNFDYIRYVDGFPVYILSAHKIVNFVRSVYPVG
jgi:hypothetical protein